MNNWVYLPCEKQTRTRVSRRTGLVQQCEVSPRTKYLNPIWRTVPTTQAHVDAVMLACKNEMHQRFENINSMLTRALSQSAIV